MLLPTLENLARDLRQIPAIHRGGCAWLASLIAPYLEGYGPVSFRVFSFSDPGASITAARRILKEHTVAGWHQVGVDLDHIMAEFEIGGTRHLFDANGVVSLSSLEASLATAPLEGALTREELQALLLDTAGWDTRFEASARDKIAHVLREHFAILPRTFYLGIEHDLKRREGKEGAASFSDQV